ncbi:MAG: hypothetical protein WD928_03915 [Gammaproteobacteria bacterium]
MKTIRFARDAALTGIAGAALVMVTSGAAVAGHGMTMKDHPLRGDFPTATDRTEPASTVSSTAAEARTAVRQRSEPGGWLRGDFPLAAESQPEPQPALPEPAAVITRGAGETWTCSVQQASALATDIGSTQAIMRVIHLDQ